MKDLLPLNLQVVFPDYPRVMHLSTQSEKEREKRLSRYILSMAIIIVEFYAQV